MRSFRTRRSAALLVAVSAGIAYADGGLVHLEVHEPPAVNRKVLDMRFDEIARDASSSTVDVTLVSGGSVASSMFVMRGMCAVARARGRTSFGSEPVEGKPARHRVTFPTPAEGPTVEVPAPGARPARSMSGVFTLQQCALVGF